MLAKVEPRPPEPDPEDGSSVEAESTPTIDNKGAVGLLSHLEAALQELLARSVHFSDSMSHDV
jgi:hypothetical protein